VIVGILNPEDIGELREKFGGMQGVDDSRASEPVSNLTIPVYDTDYGTTDMQGSVVSSREAVQKITPDLWPFRYHFRADPVVPGNFGTHGLIALLKAVARDQFGLKDPVCKSMSKKSFSGMIFEDTKQIRLNTVRRRIARLKRLQQRYSGYSSVFSTIRALVAVVFVGLVFSRISSEESWLVNGVLFLLMALFALLVFRQSKVKRKIADLTTLINYAETDISRIHLDWANIPVKSTRFQSNTEVARDLKIAGERSLVHLTDTTSSIEARDYLLELLLNSNPNADDIEYRQNLIQSLVPKHLLFARLRLAGGKMDEKELSGDAIVALLEGSTYPRWGKVLLWASAALAVINIVLLFAFGLKYFLLPFILQYSGSFGIPATAQSNLRGA